MKSHVSLETKCCPACAKIFDSGSVLLDSRLRDSMEPKTCTGFAFCETCQAKIDAGYVILVGIDETRSTEPFTPQSVWRTGQLAAIKRAAWPRIFNTDPPATIAFTDPMVLEKLACLSEPSPS